jgi:hypothetical protein
LQFQRDQEEAARLKPHSSPQRDPQASAREKDLHQPSADEDIDFGQLEVGLP